MLFVIFLTKYKIPKMYYKNRFRNKMNNILMQDFWVKNNAKIYSEQSIQIKKDRISNRPVSSCIETWRKRKISVILVAVYHVPAF